MKVKAKLVPSMKYNLCSQSGKNTAMYFGVGHSGVEVYDGIDIPPAFGQRTNVVNSIRLDQFTGLRDMRPPRVIWTYAFLPGTVEAVVSLQDTSDTTKTHHYPVTLHQVVPDNLSTTFELCSELQYTIHNTCINGLRTGTWYCCKRWYDPLAGCKAELRASLSGWPIVVS